MELIDIILSRTQRKTPTIVHPGYQLSRIRGFYMQKIKFASENFVQKLNEIVESFPKIEEIHPFFADLINILYDKDHYKIALSQVNVVKGIIENIAKDYVKLLKYGDSLYRCKTLKVAAFGRMCTAIKKINPSLTYLEEVRRHLGRLPNVDAFSPTILIFGFPNVGKSSFLNRVSNANVEVSSMPFSTQNLFVGHCLHKNVKIQFLDSPGVLKRAIEERNNIEMQALTALAHLKTAVLFLIDVSETSGYSIEEQIGLFRELRPLYSGKPVVIGYSKVDLLRQVNELEEEANATVLFAPPSDEDGEELETKRKILAQFQEEERAENPNITFMEFSNEIDESVEGVRVAMCDKLLAFRLNQRKVGDNRKLKSDEDYLMGVKVQMPTVTRNTIHVRPHIPDAVKRERRQLVVPEEFVEKQKTNKIGKYLNLPFKKRKTLKDVQMEMGGAGVFNFPNQEHFLLENPNWKYDKVPEIWNGVNIADYVDPEIERKLQELEAEEEERLKQLSASRNWEEERREEEEWVRGKEMIQEIEEEKKMAKNAKRMEGNTKKKVQRDREAMLQELRDRLDKKGQQGQEVMRKVIRKRKLRQRRRAEERKMVDPNAIIEETTLQSQGKRLVRRRVTDNPNPRDRSVSRRGEFNRKEYKGEKMKRKVQKKIFKAGLKGDGDRGIYTKKPKHLFSGKMGKGTKDWR